ncbi:carbohydrate ABC transporter permease [Paenibacillus oryzisoli]|uniref:carbohydrate ABC transporter permease n=1 Tax=Paenibacillus oryzisoli TaxID=1850517 RepID=UPI003D27267E
MAGKRLRLTLLYVFASVLLLMNVWPYIYMILSSLAPWDQVDKSLIPTHFTLRSYTWIFTGGESGASRPWLGALFNSFFVTLSSTLLMLFSAVLVGYAITKLKFKGSRAINTIILFQMFFPAVIILVPTFMIVKEMGLVNTYLGMILPKSVSLWAIFMYTNYFRGIPNEMIEAAKMDGVSEMRVVFQIIMPIAKSITTILFLFMERWVELLWDMLVVKTEKLITLNVMLAQMFGPYQEYPGPLYAASVILTLPVLILFIAFSKNFKEGMQFALK